MWRVSRTCTQLAVHKCGCREPTVLRLLSSLTAICFFVVHGRWVRGCKDEVRQGSLAYAESYNRKPLPSPPDRGNHTFDARMAPAVDKSLSRRQSNREMHRNTQSQFQKPENSATAQQQRDRRYSLFSIH